MSEDLRQTVRRIMPGVLAELEALLRVPSVSADPPPRRTWAAAPS